MLRLTAHSRRPPPAVAVRAHRSCETHGVVASCEDCRIDQPTPNALMVCALSARHLGVSPESVFFASWPEPANERDDEIRSIVLDSLISGSTDQRHCRRAYALTTGSGRGIRASVLTQLAADADLVCGSSRTDRLEIDGLAERKRFPRPPEAMSVTRSAATMSRGWSRSPPAPSLRTPAGGRSTTSGKKHAPCCCRVRASRGERRRITVDNICRSLSPREVAPDDWHDGARTGIMRRYLSDHEGVVSPDVEARWSCQARHRTGHLCTARRAAPLLPTRVRGPKMGPTSREERHPGDRGGGLRCSCPPSD